MNESPAPNPGIRIIYNAPLTGFSFTLWQETDIKRRFRRLAPLPRRFSQRPLRIHDNQDAFVPEFIINSPEEIEKMRVAGSLAASVLDMIEPHVEPGITTDELDRICYRFITLDLDAIPAPLNYRGFPKSICTSVNNVVCHGIPGPRTLKKGDIINIDVTVIKDGFHGDTSRMFFAGKPSILAERLCRVSFESMCKGIQSIKSGTRLCDLGKSVQKHAETNGFSVVRNYCGHGIGRVFHQEPQVLHYMSDDTRELQAGMTITVEPMINAGGKETRALDDGWTVVTKDRSLSAQWEHTILVTETGYEVLTQSPSQPRI